MKRKSGLPIEDSELNEQRVAAKLRPISNRELRLVVRSVCRRSAERRRAVPCAVAELTVPLVDVQISI